MKMIEEWKIYRDARRNGRKGSGGSNGCLWEVSNLGNVRKNGEIVQPYLFEGYYLVNKKFVHRMVAECFIPNPENKPQVDHIDTNRLNNNVDNLKWVTQSENNRNSITNDRMKGRNPNEEQRKKQSERMKGRKRVYHDDGTWHMTKK